MAQEIFVVQNVSTNKVEIKDFGILILPDTSIDLVEYDEVLVSDEVENYLLSGDLVRLIDGSIVSYEEAFEKPLLASQAAYVSNDVSIGGIVYIDGSLYIPPLGDVGTYSSQWSQRNTNALSEVQGSGVTQVAPLDYPITELGSWHPWGNTVWDASGLGSTVDYNNWAIWFADLNQSVEASIGFDFTGYSDGIYVTYIKHVDGSVYLDVSTNLDRESIPDHVFMSVMNIRDGLVKNIGNYPDIFATSPVVRDLLHTSELPFIGLDITTDTSSSLSRAWGQYLLEGANLTGIDFYNSSFTSPQNLATFEDVSVMEFTETHPIKGLDPSVSSYTDWRLYANRRWDSDSSTFVDASAGYYMISAIYLTAREKRHLVRRDGVLYENLLEALESIDSFEGTAAEIAQPLEELFPLISYIVSKTDIDDVTDPTQLRITRTADAAGAINEGGATGFGQYASYNDDLPEQSTTSTTYVPALSLITDSSALASTYRIGWTLQVANSKNGKTTSYQITVDSSVIEEVDMTAIAANSYSNFSGFQHLEVTDGSHNVQVEYKAATGSTAYIRDVRLEFFRAATDEVGQE